MRLAELLTPRAALGLLQGRIEGLTDDEMRWAPVPGALQIGDAPPRFAHYDGSAEPFTTIGWRLEHLAAFISSQRVADWLGAGAIAPEVPPHATAGEMVRWIELGTAWCSDLVESLDDEHLRVPIGVGPFARAPRAGFLVHIHNELLHHGGEVGVLRDLWRAGLR